MFGTVTMVIDFVRIVLLHGSYLTIAYFTILQSTSMYKIGPNWIEDSDPYPPWHSMLRGM